MKFVIKHPTKPNVFLRKPRFVGDSVHWTEPNSKPISTQEPWVFATRSGAEKARDMHALEASVEASVEAWYEAGDTAYGEVSPRTVTLSPANVGRWQQCPAAIPTPQYNNGMQDYMLAAVLADLLIVSSDFGGC